MSDIKHEAFSVLQLSPKYNGDHTTLKFAVSDLSDAVAQAIVDDLHALKAAFKPVGRPLGYELRKFADEKVAFVLKAIEEAATQPVVVPVEVPAPVAKPKKSTKAPSPVVEPVVEDVVVETPVVETPVVEETIEQTE